MKPKIVKRPLADGTVKEYHYYGKGKRLPGSLGDLIRKYQVSPEFASLAQNTKITYFRAMKHMVKWEGCKVEDLRRRHVIKMRDRLKDRPALANQVVATFSVLMGYAIDLELRETNPAHRVKFLKGGHYRRWTEDEIDFAMRTFPERLRRPMVLALYTGQRMGDVLAMKWSDYDGQGVAVTQEKTGAKLWIPCHRDLQAELEVWKRDRRSTTILADSRGRPYKAGSFATIFSAEIRRHVELTGLVFHGLRKVAAAKLAEAGCEVSEIASVTGHKSLAMLQLYTAEVDQRRLATAAIRKLEQKR